MVSPPAGENNKNVLPAKHANNAKDQTVTNQFRLFDWEKQHLSGARELIWRPLASLAGHCCWHQHLRFPAIGLFLLSWRLAVGLAPAATVSEDFTGDPLAQGWRSFGDASLFHWNASSQQLDVTWDSARPNSYFVRPLGTVLTKSDDFSFACDLLLLDVLGGVNPAKPGPFQISLGLLNLASATNADFVHGTVQSPNLVELDYFPAGEFPDFGAVDPTVSLYAVSASRQPVGSFTFPLELPTNEWLHVTVIYTSASRTLRATIIRADHPLDIIRELKLPAGFTDFRVDAFSISSFTDAGDRYDSILTHGVVDNVLVTIPSPPVTELTGGFSDSHWQVQFLSRTDWSYTLERSADFISWETVSSLTAGTGEMLTLSEINSTSERAAFYRVQAQRP